MFGLAREYAASGMPADVELKGREFALAGPTEQAQFDGAAA